MGDSDDEYDRRRGRDKFRRERNDYNDRGATTNRREEWTERSDSGTGNWNSSQRDRNVGRRDYRDNNYNQSGRVNHMNRNDRYSPGDRSGDMSPPAKRMVRGRDWEDRFPNYELGGSGGGGSGSYHGSGGGGHHSHSHRDNWSHDRDKDDEIYQPPMLTLKQFLHDQDDHIDEETLIKKYNDYKTEFRRTQLQEFFNRHKDEEWFRCKYFPDEIEKRKEYQDNINRKRLEVFMELYELKYFENVCLDVDKSDSIIRVLDAAVIKLEGGSDFDLRSLDETSEETKTNKESSIFAVDSSSASKASKVPNKSNDDENSQEPKAESSMDLSTDDTGEIKEHKDEEGETGEVDSDTNTNGNNNKNNNSGGDEGELPSIGIEEDSGDGELLDDDTDDIIGTNKLDTEDLSGELNDSIAQEAKPRALHKTCSIFFRNLSPSITRQEIEDECKKFSGFLRLAISEPQMDRRFNRRGWATFERTVNIREICWALNSVKIRGCEIGPIVNRDLTRRIRSVNGMSSHKSVVRADIRHAAKLIMKLDAQKHFWQDNEDDADSNKNGGSLSAPSRNPLLKNITDYLIEEAPAEEEELLGISIETDPLLSASGDGEISNGNSATVDGGATVERDDELTKVLDLLILYLRIVHSFDYYNHSEYFNEDEMPNRIGLIHARGLFSSSRVTPTEIEDYLKEIESKISPLLEATPLISPEEARKLGQKVIEDAVEAFIKENTKELGEGKWLCPLSNKKFVGGEFVRKHILNKHAERVEQVRAETHYFNNYILDPKRPQLPEHPLNRPSGSANQNRSDGGGHGSILGPSPGSYGGGGGHGHYGRNSLGHNYQPGGRYGLTPYHQESGYQRNNMRRNRYRDLDAPNED